MNRVLGTGLLFLFVWSSVAGAAMAAMTAPVFKVSLRSGARSIAGARGPGEAPKSIEVIVFRKQVDLANVDSENFVLRVSTDVKADGTFVAALSEPIIEGEYVVACGLDDKATHTAAQCVGPEPVEAVGDSWRP